MAAPPFGWLQYEIQDTDGNQPAALSAFVVNEAAVHVTRLLPRGRIALTEGRWSLHGKAAELAPIVDQPFTIVAGQETFARFTTHPARISQIAFWLPDPGCGYQLTLRHGDEEIVSARASSLLRVGRDGYCWLMGTLPEGEHVLTLVGPNDSWRTRFTVHGDLPLGQPLLVTLEALP